MIIVTGATGFIGRYLVEQLTKDNVDVLATGRDIKGQKYYENKGIPYISVDITNEKDFDKLPQKNVEAVVHLAALLSIDTSKWSAKDYIMVNALGTYYVLEYCRKTKVPKIIYAMTHSDVNRTNDIVITEETPRKFGGPLPYIVAKIAGMNFIEGYVQDNVIKQGIVFRFPGIRGYTSRDTYYDCVFHQFIQKAIKSEPIEIWGDHKTKRDLIYIQDVVYAICGALKSEKANGLYNIGSGVGLTIEDEAKAIINVFSPADKPSKLIYRTDIEEVRKKSQIFDISKAKRDFGWAPQFSYEEGLMEYKKEMELNRFKDLIDIKNKY